LVLGGKTLDDFVAIKEEPSPDPAWTLRIFQSISVPTLQIRTQWRTIGVASRSVKTSGAALKEMAVIIAKTRSSVLLEYRRVAT